MIKDKVVLIGMPGSGKSTIGKLLADKLGYSFCDMDSFIESLSNKTIGDLFSMGEEIFRNWESAACRQLVKKQRAVISAGGGVVKIKSNVDILKNGCIVLLISRDIEKIIGDIDIESRPLLHAGKDCLYGLYEERRDLYLNAADYVIENDSSIDDTVERAVKLLENKISL